MVPHQLITIYQTAVLQHHLCSHGAEILADASQLPLAALKSSNLYILLVPHQMLKRDVPSIPNDLQQATVATEMWVERCLYSKERIDPSMHIANTPFAKHPIMGKGFMTLLS